jgi:hypothetical protein
MRLLLYLAIIEKSRMWRRDLEEGSGGLRFVEI